MIDSSLFKGNQISLFEPFLVAAGEGHPQANIWVLISLWPQKATIVSQPMRWRYLAVLHCIISQSPIAISKIPLFFDQSKVSIFHCFSFVNQPIKRFL